MVLLKSPAVTYLQTLRTSLICTVFAECWYEYVCVVISRATYKLELQKFAKGNS